MSTKRATVADVAGLAGTSTAVVSYVVNNGPRPVSAPLRARVLEAMNELGYRPDRAARALRLRPKWRQLGLLVPDITMPFFATLAREVEERARARNQLVMTGSTGFDLEVEADFVSAFADAGVDGLIIAGEGDGTATRDECTRLRVPAVWVHNARNLDGHNVVQANQREASYLATRHLVDTHRCVDLAFVGGKAAVDGGIVNSDTVSERYRGFRSAVDSSGTIIETDSSLAGTYEATRRYLRERAVPDAIVVGTYGQSAPVLRALSDADLTVPGDVAVVSFDGDPRSDYEHLVLTTVRQDIGALAARALDIVLGVQETTRIERTFIDILLHPSESCGCPHTPASLTRTPSPT